MKRTDTWAQWGKEGWDELEAQDDAETLPRIKQRAREKQLSSVLCDDLDMWDGGGREVQEGGIYVRIELIPSSRKWQPTPVFLPGKFHGQRNLAGYNPWAHKESDTTTHARIADSGHCTAETNTAL